MNRFQGFQTTQLLKLRMSHLTKSKLLTRGAGFQTVTLSTEARARHSEGDETGDGLHDTQLCCTRMHTNTHTHYMQPSSQALRSQVAPSELGQQSVLFPGIPLPKAPETRTRSCWLSPVQPAVLAADGPSHCGREAGQAPFQSGHKGHFRTSKEDVNSR